MEIVLQPEAIRISSKRGIDRLVDIAGLEQKSYQFIKCRDRSLLSYLISAEMSAYRRQEIRRRPCVFDLVCSKV